MRLFRSCQTQLYKYKKQRNNSENSKNSENTHSTPANTSHNAVAEGVPVCKKNVREVSLHFHELDHVA